MLDAFSSDRVWLSFICLLSGDLDRANSSYFSIRSPEKVPTLVLTFVLICFILLGPFDSQRGISIPFGPQNQAASWFQTILIEFVSPLHNRVISEGIGHFVGRSQMSVSTGLFSWSNIPHRNLSFFSLAHIRLAAYDLEAKWGKGILIRTKNILCLLVMTRTFMIHFLQKFTFQSCTVGRQGSCLALLMESQLPF